MNYYALVLEYHGESYCGWQRQSHSPSVQFSLEKALSQIANEPIEVTCAGRTDAGVHALAQVVNFQTDVKREDKAWLIGANSLLPKDIKVSKLYHVDKGFSARFSATYRRYQYLIYNHPVSSAVFLKNATWVKEHLDLDKMNEACQNLLGEQDFTTFRSSQCQSHTSMRNIHHAYFKRYGRFVLFDIQGNAFLHHMVRNITGSMLKVGLKLYSPDWIRDIVDLKDRTKAAETAPAVGLYLVEVAYPEGSQVLAAHTLESFLGIHDLA